MAIFGTADSRIGNMFSSSALTGGGSSAGGSAASVAGSSSLAGGLAVGAGMGLVDSLMGFGLGQASASKAWDRYKNSLTRGPTYAMQGYRDAGINPILVARGGKLGASSNFTTQGNAQKAGMAAAAQGMALQQAQIKLIQQQTATSAAQAASLTANARYTDSQNQDIQFGWPKKRVERDYYDSNLGGSLTQVRMTIQDMRKTLSGAGVHSKLMSVNSALNGGAIALGAWLLKDNNAEWLLSEGKALLPKLESLLREMTQSTKVPARVREMLNDALELF